MPRITAARLVPIQVSDRTLWRHVILTTDSGLTGLGEASWNAAPPGFDAMLETHAHSLIGSDLSLQTMSAHSDLLTRGRPGHTIYSALDQAVEDLIARHANLPLCTSLNPGATPADVPLYANINRATRDRSPEGCAASARAAVAQGHKALKFAPFDDLTPDKCGSDTGQSLINAALDRLSAIRGTAPDTTLQVDCHWRLTFQSALDLIPDLAALNITWFECPLPETTDAIHNLRRIRARANDAGMRLTGLESFGRWSDIAPYITAGAYDVAMPDVKYAGGLRAILEIAERAAEHSTQISLHNPSGPVAHLHSLHVMRAVQSAERMEIQWNETPLFETLTTPAPRVTMGQAHIPKGPGIASRFS